MLLAACGRGASTTPSGETADSSVAFEAGGDGAADAGDAASARTDGGQRQDATADGSVEASADGGVDASPGVFVRGGQLVIDGTPTFLYGGDLHYFRVRDPSFDAQATQALWADSIAKMQAAHMNLVTTYFPWDYHAPAAGQWDFTGARDVGAFLTMACNAGMKVVAKPGPLITGEWPNGFGSFGAVPAWWKAANPGSLVLQSDGSRFTFSPTGDTTQAQPSFLDPAYLTAVGQWFDQIVPILVPFIQQRCIVGVQIDNETNLYWSARFGAVDYNPVALAQYSSFLAQRYTTVAALNAAYGSSYATFDDVTPPGAVPASAADNVPARDWYDAGEAYVLAYMQTIRSMLEQRGIHEPDVLFMANDSPFGSPTAKVLVHDGTIKDQVGLGVLDLYPKQYPTNSDISDYPFQADYATKLYAEEDLLYTKDVGSSFAYAAELQGGFYDFPLGVTPPVSPEATDQLLAKSIGHGLKGGSFYIVRGGLNADGSSYDYQAAIGLDGTLRPRYAVMQKWGAFLETYGSALEDADEVEDPIAIVQDGAYAVPQAGTNDDLQAMYIAEYNALFGWLINAGLNPHVVDARLVSDLSAYQEVFFLAPELVDSTTAAKLTAFSAGGGTLVQMLDPGSMALDGTVSPEVQALAALFGATANGEYTWPGVGLCSGSANQTLAGSTGTVDSYWYETYWTPADPLAIVDMVERTEPLGTNGRTMAFETSAGGGGTRAFLGTYVASLLDTNGYYEADVDEMTLKTGLALHLASLAGVSPTVSAQNPLEEAWARKGRGPSAPAFVFVVNDHAAGTLHVSIGALAPLGLDAATSYTVTEGLTATMMSTQTGAQLLAGGVDIALAQYGTAVLVLSPM